MEFKLISAGVDGIFYKAVKALYKNPVACVQVNDMRTGWFPTPLGVKQGDVLSPTLFSLFINDLAQQIKNEDIGVQIGDMNLNILLYADDIVILAEREEELQSLLDIVNHWCQKWRMSVNQEKTQVIHFRKRGVSRSTFNFYVGVKPLSYTRAYEYLGFTLDEYLLFEEGINTLVDTSGRALGSIISKMKNCRDLGCTTFSKLYDVCVSPILLCAAGIWGGKEFSKVNAIQNRAIRCFLCVHKFTPVLALQGDMGWEPCLIKQKGEMLRLWNRLSSMPEGRIAKRVFNWDKAYNYPWCSEMNAVFNEADQQHIFTNGLRCSVNFVKHKLFLEYKEKWANDIWFKPKLRN